MSRAVDLLLLGALAFLGWKLLHMDLSFAGSESKSDSMTFTVRAGGDADLRNLGVIIRSAGELDSGTVAPSDVAPHQLTPWDEDRTATVIVPGPGQYEVRWGVQDEAPPRRARDVMIELVKAAKAPDQIINVPAKGEGPIEIELGEAHAVGIQAHAQK